MSSLPVRCESEHLLHGVCVIIIIIISSSSSMPIPGGSLVLKRECMYSMTGLLIYCSNAVIAISYYNTFVIIFTRIIFNFVRQVNGNNYKSKSTKKRAANSTHTHRTHISQISESKVTPDCNSFVLKHYIRYCNTFYSLFVLYLTSMPFLYRFLHSKTFLPRRDLLAHFFIVRYCQNDGVSPCFLAAI